MGKISFVYLRIFSAQNKQTRTSFANIRKWMPYLSWAKLWPQPSQKMSQNRGESYGKSESLNCVLYALFILAKEAANLRVSVSLLLGQWVRVLGLVRAAYLSPWRDVASSVENVQSVIHHLYEPCIKNVFFISRDFFLEFYSFDRTIKRFSTLLEMGKGNRTKLKTFLWISGVLFSKQSGSVVRYKKNELGQDILFLVLRFSRSSFPFKWHSKWSLNEMSTQSEDTTNPQPGTSLFYWYFPIIPNLKLHNYWVPHTQTNIKGRNP